MGALSPTVRSVLPFRSATSRTLVRPEAMTQRALALWPRLDRRALGRCAGDPARIARLVARRTSLPPAIIRAILDPGVSEEDQEFWFG